MNVAAMPGAPGAGGGNVEPLRVRENFPETWMWTDKVAGSNGQAAFKVTVPDTITSWVVSAFALSSSKGLGIADPTSIISVLPFFISTDLPYSVIRGEEFGLQVTVFNYLDTSVSVDVTLEKSTFFGVRTNGLEPVSQDVTTTIQIESNKAGSVAFWVVPTALGQIPINVKARSLLAADAVRVLLLVKPEGTQESYSNSVLIQLTSTKPFNAEMTLAFPPAGVLVPDSQYMECTAVGDLLGPSLDGLENLISMPGGCGEQNMLGLAPDVYIARYLKASKRDTPALMDTLVQYMTQGYQTELTYFRDSEDGLNEGGVSAFGNNDNHGSTWLSAFVLDVFYQAKEFIPIEDVKLAGLIRFILRQQNDNGSFGEPGRVIHTDMQGGASHGLTLSAYATAVLCNTKTTDGVDQNQLTTAINKAVALLEGTVGGSEFDSYDIAIITYALFVCGSSRADESFTILKSKAINNPDGTTYWTRPTTQDTDQYADANGNAIQWRPPYYPEPSVAIEATSYAVLCYMKKGDVTGALPAAKWLVAKRSSLGGYEGTQDTVMAIKALSEVAKLVIAPAGSSITVTITAGGQTTAFKPITSTNALIKQTIVLPKSSKKVQIAAKGKGLALVQCNVRYNIYNALSCQEIKLDLTQRTNDAGELVSTLCGSWLGDVESGMVLLEFTLLTGYTCTNWDTLETQANGNLKRKENNGEKIVLYYNELTEKPFCIDINTKQSQLVNKVQKGMAKIYRYYDPKAFCSKTYEELDKPSDNPCDVCKSCCVFKK
jgi:CD109 antigen